MSDTKRTDKELIESYRNGCLSDFELLVSRYQEQIYNYVFSLVKDRQLCDDIFQDTFVKVIRTIKAGLYHDEGKFIQFAMRIAHNLVIDHFRKENRIPVVESSSEDFNYVDNAPITDPSVEQGMIVDQIHSDLRNLVERLPVEQREVLRLRIYEDMSFKEIADITNVSINTALGRMRYALINLRKMAEVNNICLTY
ncbi:MAG: sigma-70 family RNA polymerase sigma factor [Bacteroidales bacterium]|jgi:RNA polymerase sigma-70 factor (ECF subfamily)|nr:sigma-70 family RNA polymerase sigma factor [Bacteroidales bacterium]MBQ5957905.1 sigma-70 family RNA polymerase sigma factor [Bacteroidales bacterium]